MQGLVDIHAHVLPGIDDGPRDLSGTLELARSAAEAGITRIAATPHLRSDFPDVHVEEIAARAERVQAELEAVGIDLEVVPGAEVSLIWALEASDEQLRLASYGQRGQDVLIETPEDVSMLEQLLYEVRIRGLRVTLAHPERSGHFQHDAARLTRLAEQGVLLQVNADALLAPARSSLRRLAARLCWEGTAHVIASDGHRGHDWRPVDRLAKGAEALAKLVGPERARWMVTDAPAAILAGQPLPPEPEVQRRGGLLTRWRS